MMYQSVKWALAAAVAACVLPASAQLFDNIAGVEKKDDSAAVAISPPPTAQATQPKVDVAPVANAPDLANYIDLTQTLSGDFEQVVFSDRGQETSSGSFRLKRPGMFDWVYNRPSEQRIISNGAKVYHYDKDLEQITIRPRSELAGDAAMNLLVGDKKLKQTFSVQEKSASQAPARLRTGESGLHFYELKPKKGDEVDKVWVVMDNERIVAVYVDTGVGQESVLMLRNVVRNKGMSVKSFQFTPPAGVDVIGG